MTGAESLAALLRSWGYSTIFAYPGTSELALCAAVDHQDGLVLLNARGDKEAAFMAAGGDLLEGTRCAAILHGARGLTNALGAVADVRRSEIPVLYLVGLPPRSSAPFLPPHGEPGLIPDAGAFAKSAVDCSAVDGYDPHEYIKCVVEALEMANELPMGPVLLGIPQDLLSARFVASEVLAEARRARPMPPEPEAAESAEAVNLIRRSSGPSSWLTTTCCGRPMARWLSPTSRPGCALRCSRWPTGGVRCCFSGYAGSEYRPRRPVRSGGRAPPWRPRRR